MESYEAIKLRLIESISHERHGPPRINKDRLSIPEGNPSSLQFVVMTNRDPFLPLPMEVHRAAKAVFKHLAVGALARLHPSAIAERLETVLPHIEEVVLRDVALHKAAVDVGAGGDGSVDKDGTDGDAGTAEIEPVADLALVRTDVGLTTELGINLSFLASGNDEVHQLTHLLAIELQVGIVGSSTDRLDAEKAPRLHFVLNKQLFHSLQLAEIHRTDASDNVVSGQTFLVGQQVDGTQGMVEAALTFAESVVRVAQPIKTDSDAVHASVYKFLVHRLVIGIPIADDTPRKTMLPKLSPTVSQVGTHQRLTARDDYQDRITLIRGLKRFDGVQEILKRHVFIARRG